MDDENKDMAAPEGEETPAAPAWGAPAEPTTDNEPKADEATVEPAPEA